MTRVGGWSHRVELSAMKMAEEGANAAEIGRALGFDRWTVRKYFLRRGWKLSVHRHKHIPVKPVPRIDTPAPEARGGGM